jgi:hypothetical protein
MDKVILIGNHPRDGSESMDRYTHQMWQGMKERGNRSRNSQTKTHRRPTFATQKEPCGQMVQVYR